MTDSQDKSLSFDDKLTPDEREAFYEPSPPRAMAVIIGAIVENHLTDLLKRLFRNDKTAINELFAPSGPLGPFATKIRLAYVLSVLDKTTHDDLMVVSKIRNKFAHDLSVKNFDGQQIADWVKNMHIYSVLLELKKKYRSHLNDDSNVAKATAAHILRDAFLDMEGSFKICARFLIDHLVALEHEIEQRGAVMSPHVPWPPASPEKSS